MKHSIKPVFLCLFAVLFSGCLPHEQISGRVISTTGPVPQAAILAMVWIEDGDKAKPEPDVKNLNPEERGAAYDKDMKERGLPMAYTRAFCDKDGRFTLDKLYFSAETKKAVKAMKQPRITRITLNAFQRGYIKHAVTTFVKDTDTELPPATVTLSRPDNWKQLALDNYFRTLRRDEYDYGYSKAFGATKEEKEWFLTYTQSNLENAYAESNIKGDKQWEEDCGHDYSDVMISTAGMQRNPAHEKCADLLHQAGVLRDWKDQWLDHAMAVTETPEPAVSAVKAAVEALGPEYAEVKANETQIVAGVTEAVEQYKKGRTNQNLSDKKTTAEPQRLYNIGDKIGAYKALGYALYAQLPVEIKQGVLTAQIPVTTLPGIRDTAAGFYLQMNRPQTAQLPNGDNGDHKDKAEYKTGESTETIKLKIESLRHSESSGTIESVELGDLVHKVDLQHYPKGRKVYSNSVGQSPVEQGNSVWAQYLSAAMQSLWGLTWDKSTNTYDWTILRTELMDRLDFKNTEADLAVDVFRKTGEAVQSAGVMERLQRGIPENITKEMVNSRRKSLGEYYDADVKTRREKLQKVKVKISSKQTEIETSIKKLRATLTKDQQNAFLFWLEEKDSEYMSKIGNN